jgi:muramidase (phage lysozyme)
MSPNLKAFLDVVATSELTDRLLRNSDNGYNCLVGSLPNFPRLFYSYADHPRQLIDLPRLGIKSTAAGRYQLLARYFDVYKKQLGLPNFSPESQDAIAIQQIRECKALIYVEAGRFDDAVARVSNIWASLPGSPYGQHTNDLDALRRVFIKAGGTIDE